MAADEPAYTRLLSSEATSKIGRLEYLARTAIEGAVTGRHQSPYKGSSVEFAEHRQYVPGDDVRDLDWNAYAKQDRFYIKQYVDETNLRATIVVDASGSMKYVGEHAAEMDGRKLSKFEYASYLAACMTWLFMRQQDAVGLVTFDTEVRDYIPARTRATQLRQILETLVRTEPGGETGVADVLHDVAERIHRRGMVVIISDLFGDPEQVVNALHHFRYRFHQVTVLHVMADEEICFPFNKFTDFIDLEPSSRSLQIDPKTVRAQYLDRIREFVEQIETGCGQMKADYVPLNTNESFDTSLANYLARR
ncbi:MAG: DUF58 domain-containing protein [Planctomycetota bacterium]|jgi:uncharacterized protein (DUF58 family)|nr:DUF58 domain-containing protein [Planctomycetota bacterium]